MAIVFKNYGFDPVSGRGSIEIHGDVDVSIVNGVRRTLITEIPYVGFRAEPFDQATIHITKNNGPLNNEILSQRISLLPIHLPLKDLESYQDGDLKFKIHVHNTENKLINVTTSDMELEYKGQPVDNQIIFPKNALTGDNIVITRLRKDEVFEVEGHAVMGTSRDNISFSPLSLCTYRFLQTPEAADVKDPLEKERMFYKNRFGEPTAYLFQLESECGHKFHDILLYGTTTLIQNAKALFANLPVPKKNDQNIGYDFEFEKQDDTLGNILQSLMYNEYIRNKRLHRNKKVAYVGYFCPHPLEHRMVLRINIEDGSEDDFVSIMKDTEDIVLRDLESFKNAIPDSDTTSIPMVTEPKVPPKKQEPVAEVPPSAATAATEKKEKEEDTKENETNVAKSNEMELLAGTELALFMASKNVPEEKVSSFVVPADGSGLSMKITDRVATVLREYKQGRKTVAVVAPNKGAGTLALSFSGRFQYTAAVQSDSVLRAAQKKNVDVLGLGDKIAVYNDVATAVADGKNKTAKGGKIDILVVDSSDSTNVRTTVQMAQSMFSDVTPAYIAILMAKKTDIGESTTAMQQASFNLVHKEVVMKEVLCMVFESSSA